MKKIISVLAVIGLCTFGFAQETQKGGCCAGKDKKECSVKDKKACGDNHKSCDTKAKTADAKKKSKK
ncbi:hypothetical protein [uncultured Chryseobacterium sp.]|jgi:hypothetical protein|uniref:hypothetical protein n=1 Tax=uncultured Chryseobacterium sp. TaxID=259322 RepID=UPI00260495B7|nr:hypothetical protein [uncultured Chryseobacterium sp.]